MLVRFRISNFLSFREETEFNMLTGSPRRFEHHVYAKAGVEILKMCGIYGANGAGKSNLIKAFLYLRKLIVSGWIPVSTLQFKLHHNKNSKPSTFELEFISEGIGYVYGIDVNTRHIEEEWLYKAGVTKDDELIFHRYTKNGITQIKYSPLLFKTNEDKLRMKLYETEILSENTTLLNTLAHSKVKIPEITSAFNWFDNHLHIIQPETRFNGVMLDMVQNPFFFQFVNDMMCSFQTGITSLQVVPYSFDAFFGKDNPQLVQENKAKLDSLGANGVVIFESKGTKEEIILMYENNEPVVKRILFLHLDSNQNDMPFELWQESDGTRRLFELAPALFKAIYNESIVLIDEFEHSLHPTLLREIISKFANTPNTKGQLVFTTHEAYLLDQDYMRQDEFWFAEKDDQGATTYAPLSDYKIRYDLDLRKGYLSGRFGAVPQTRALHQLQWNKYAEAKHEPTI